MWGVQHDSSQGACTDYAHSAKQDAADAHARKEVEEETYGSKRALVTPTPKIMTAL